MATTTLAGPTRVGLSIEYLLDSIGPIGPAGCGAEITSSLLSAAASPDVETDALPGGRSCWAYGRRRHPVGGWGAAIFAITLDITCE